MATTTPIRTIVGSTGASGAAGFAAAITAHNTAIATAVTTALAVTGTVPSSLIIGNTGLSVGLDGLQEMFTAINYVTIV